MIEIHLFSLMIGLLLGAVIGGATIIFSVFIDSGAWSDGFKEGMRHARETEREQMKGEEE